MRTSHGCGQRRGARVGARHAALLLLFACAAAPAAVTVEIRGIEGALRENVQQRLAIADAGGELDAEAVHRLHAQALRQIADALQPFGYYTPQIGSSLAGAGSDWRATYIIEPGVQTRVREVDVVIEGEGANLPELQPVLARLRALSGGPLRHDVYERLKAELAGAAYGQGCLDTHYTRAELRVQPALARADIALSLDTAARYRFGEVQFEDPKLDPAFLRRYLPLVPGAPFEPQKLLDAQFALVDLDYFQTIELVPLREETHERRIPIRVRTTLKPKYRYDTGIGYGTDTGARLSLAAENRHFNDRGHRLRGDLRLSEIKNSVLTEYRIPLGERAAEQLSFSGTAISERLDDGDSLKYGLGASLSRVPGDWQRRLYLTYEHEESQLGIARQTADLLMPGVSLTRTEQDNAIHARRGWSLFLDLHGAHKAVIANTTFLQGRIAARGALPLGARGRLLLRTEQGASLVEEFSELPASQRFFAGGDQSVRGYRHQSIGPVDASGKVIGGRYLSVYSVEFDHPVWRNWGAALFYDIGGAADEPGPKMLAGTGVGLRYRAPVGFIQLDVAHPLDGDAQGVRLHLGVRVGL